MSDLRRSLPIVCLAFAILMADGFDLQAIGFLVPEIAASWSLPKADFGFVLAAALAGSIPGAALAGFAARWMGVRGALMLSLALFGVFTLAALGVNEISKLAALRFFAGIGLGAAVPLAVNVVAHHSPARMRNSLLTFALCGQLIGAIAGGALCERLMPIYGWRVAFLLGGIVPLLLIPAVLVLLRPRAAVKGGLAVEPSTRTPPQFASLFSADLLMTTAILWTSTILASFCVNIIFTWLPSAMRSGGSSLQTSIWAVSLFSFGGVIGALIAAPLMDRYGPRKVMPPLFGLAGVSMAVLSLSISDPALCLAAALSGLTGYGGAVLLGPLAVSLYPAKLHTMGIGWMLGIGRLGAALGALGAGVAIGAGLIIGRLFWFTAAAAILVMLCLLTLARVRTSLRRAG